MPLSPVVVAVARQRSALPVARQLVTVARVLHLPLTAHQSRAVVVAVVGSSAERPALGAQAEAVQAVRQLGPLER
jgi:hypothetical protein